MGCFSYLCEKCGRPINSDSFSGQHCTLFLLKDGKVIEEMTGQYDSYGRVFDENGESREWVSFEWGGVCDLHFDQDKRNGIAAIHTRCMKAVETPETRSLNDPDQGWGRYKKPSSWLPARHMVAVKKG